MVHKCANPACTEPFHRFTGGRLYGTEHSWKKGKATEFFWLCDKCSRIMTLTFNAQNAPVTVTMDEETLASRAHAA